jgi:hypothetical protein
MAEPEPTYASNAIALTDLDRFWPKGKAVPPLIGEVAALIGPWPVGAIGLFFLKASQPNDFFIENGADLWNRFGIFVAFANGTEYALWYYDGCPPGAEPVVSFGDEGGLNIIAPNLKAFFKSLAAGQGIGQIPNFTFDATPEVLAERQAYGTRLIQVVDKAPDPPVVNHPDFEAFIRDFEKEAHGRNASDPTLQAIGKLLSGYFPKDETNPRVSFSLTAQDETIKVQTTLMAPDYNEWEPLPEREALIPLLQRARNERSLNNGRGLWTSAVLYLHFGGHVQISADWA